MEKEKKVLQNEEAAETSAYSRGSADGTETAAVSSGESDGYVYETCDLGRGIRLKKYLGAEEDVALPETFKGLPVLELLGTFSDNGSVKTVRIPAMVRRIGDDTFYNCARLTDVYIPASVKEIIDFAFSRTDCTVHCAENSFAYRYTQKSGLKVMLDQTLDIDNFDWSRLSESCAFCSYADDKADEAEAIIRQLEGKNCNVTACGNLQENEKLRSFGSAGCVVAFLSRGFIDGDGMEYLRMAVREKKRYIVFPLDDCSLPEELNIDESGGKLLLFDGSAQDRIARLADWLVENGCVRISRSIPGFQYTTDTDGNIILTKYTGGDTAVIIPDKNLGRSIIAVSGAFYECFSLTSATIPDGFSVIGEGAFYRCSSLTSVKIPDSVTTIGKGAFSGCVNLTSLRIPDSVTTIGNWAFNECSGLTSVTIPEGITSIGKGTFGACSSMTSVRIPDSVTSIGEGAFSGCRRLASVTIPEGVISIGDGAFSGCRRLTAVTIPEGVASIGRTAFSRCSSLASVTIPGSVAVIEKEAFADCSYLTSVNIGRGVEVIGEGAFSECRSISALEIPDSVTSIGCDAFSGCTGLTSLKLPDSVASIGDDAFAGCGGLTVYCSEGSFARRCCEKSGIPCMPPEQFAPSPSARNSSFPEGIIPKRWRIPLILLLALAAGLLFYLLLGIHC